MPYADIERRRAYNREWWKHNQDSGANGPHAQRVEEIVREHGPIGPGEIVRRMGRSTPKSVSVALHRLRAAGRIQHSGYGKWFAA